MNSVPIWSWPVRVQRTMRRAFSARRRSSGLILLYHRIAELSADPQRLAVTPDHFAQHLEVMREYGCPTPLREIVPVIRDRRLPCSAIAVTFDDGYADNVNCGKPVLARHGIPATVFVATAYLGGKREFWWDELERLLLRPGRLPETLRLRVGPTVHAWSLGSAAFYGDDECRRDAGWVVEDATDPSPRHRVYRTLCWLLRGMPGELREAALDELASVCGTTSTPRPSHRPLSPGELGRLVDGGLIDVGAHAAAHTALSALPVAAQRSEIMGSKAHLEEITGREIAGFAYPFGSRADYTRTTVRLVQEAGFGYACSNVQGLVRRGGDRFQLSRVLVRNWDGETFAARLREWLGD